MPGLTATGFEAPTADEIADAIATDLRGALDPNLDTSPESVMGQLIAVFAAKQRELWELGAAAYGARDPGAAAGAQLDALSALTGTTRRARTKGRVTLRVQLTAGTTLPAGSIAQVNGQATNRWVTLTSVTNGTGLTAFVTVEAEAQTAGNIPANAATITVIATPVAGWLAVTNDLDAAAGLDDEADPALRARREAELSRAGSASVPGIRADLLDVADVVACSVAHNPTGALDALGRPPHSVEATVQFTPGLAGVDLDAARLAVATQLFASVAAGIDTYGDHSTTVLDPQGDPQTVRWTEPTLVSIWVEMSLTIDPATYAGDAAVKDAVLAFGDTLRLGDDVVRARLLCALVDVPGVLDVPALTLGVTATELYPQNVVINARALAAFDTSRITVAT